MKEFIKSVSNKLKAIYILWFFLHFVLWLSGGGDFSLTTMSKDHAFFPFKWYWYEYSKINFEFSLHTNINYGLDVFLIYILLPVTIFYFFRLLKMKGN